MIATKAAQVTNLFLSNTQFHTKIVMLLCKTINEKNVQLRQYAATYIKTILETHGSKDAIRSVIAEKLEVNQSIESFLRKGLADGSPHVREASRQTYSVYYDYWPDAAEKLLRSLDSSVQRLLEKNSPKSSPKPTSRPRMLSSRSNSMSSVSSKTSTSTAATSPSLFKRPNLTRSSSSHTIPKPNTIPATSLEVKRNQQISRLSHISNVSAPSTTIQHKLSKIASTTTASRRTQSEFHQQSILASASLLHMLKSNDLQMQCKGIRTLSERLRNTSYHPSPTSIILPPNVPSKIEVLPILMDWISRHDLDLRLYQLLMSWESLAGIFVYIMSFNYYCPTLIIADQECRHKAQKEADIMKVYSKGLTRIKMFLKRNDPELPQRLLDIAKSVTEANSVNDIQLLDASVKRDLVLYPQYKESLLYGLFSWMDQLVCDYVGLPEDEDSEVLMEGSQWLNVSEKESSAGQWFEDKTNIHSFVQFVIKSLLQTPSYDILSCMASHLKMANERVFESEMKLLSQQHRMVIEKALGIQPMSRLDAWIQQEDFSLLEEQGSTGMTQDISKIKLEFEPSFEEPIVEEEMLFDLEPIMDERSLDSPPPRDELPPSPILQPLSQEKKRLARSVSELSPERSQPKKRRLSEDMEPFLGIISLIKQNKADTSTFQHIQQLATTSIIWPTSYQQKSVLHLLIESLIDYLQHDQEQSEALQIQAILTIKSLLTHQSTWFKNEQSLVYQLTRTFVGKQTDNNSNIYSVLDGAVDRLLELMPPDYALSILWDISKDKDYPLGALFSHISKVAPKSSTKALEQSLQNGAVDVLIRVSFMDLKIIKSNTSFLLGL
ncbi:clasp N terminal-domain-containing protein [Gilbertella persicaria]|uniref:clasp N terminal-domain-containing protein n=1 Tax=Gilbertella persicaria TaxID=101096 RepID=UPI00221EB2D2|nr:clasp N terminal-domain-containing protein [Gilbertella persicaria]KAI8090888.1 clasp N terminal-domain-containing protein [Gilbertella persicaria]